MFSGLWGESPKESVARCETLFWPGSPGAKQCLHDSGTLLGLWAQRHQITFSTLLKHFVHFGFGCFDTCTRPAGLQIYPSTRCPDHGVGGHGMTHHSSAEGRLKVRAHLRTQDSRKARDCNHPHVCLSKPNMCHKSILGKTFGGAVRVRAPIFEVLSGLPTGLT